MPRFLPQNTIPVSITNKSIVAQTYQKPDEGNRSVYFELSGPTPSQCYQVNIPNWNSNTQTGLSQICALRVDAAQLRWVEGTSNAAVPIAIIYFPDSNDYIEISEDSYGIYPVVTSGSTFYINFPAGGSFIAPALLAVTVLNFYEAPLKTYTGPMPVDLLEIGKTSINGLNGLPVFFNTAQNVNATLVGFPAAQSYASSGLVILATSGVTTATIKTGAVTITAFECSIYAMESGGGVALSTQLLLDGSVVYERNTSYPNFTNTSDDLIMRFTGMNIGPSVLNVQVRFNVFVGSFSISPGAFAEIWYH